MNLLSEKERARFRYSVMQEETEVAIGAGLLVTARYRGSSGHDRLFH